MLRFLGLLLSLWVLSSAAWYSAPPTTSDTCTLGSCAPGLECFFPECYGNATNGCYSFCACPGFGRNCFDSPACNTSLCNATDACSDGICLTCPSGQIGNSTLCRDCNECAGECGGHTCDISPAVRCINVAGSSPGFTCNCSATYVGNGTAAGCVDTNNHLGLITLDRHTYPEFEFRPTSLSYFPLFDFQVTTVTVTPSLQSSTHGRIIFNDSLEIPNNTAVVVSVEPGLTFVPITVIPGSGANLTYNLYLQVQFPESNFELESLNASNCGPLTPPFSPSTTSYSCVMPFGLSSTVITAPPRSPNSTHSINTNYTSPSPPLPLNTNTTGNASTIFTVSVTSYWGTMLFYTLTVNTILTCPNGIRDSFEGCDDGNFNSTDGCTQNCTVQNTLGYACPGNIGSLSVCNNYCGNGVQGPTEQCDDGNSNNLDGCSNTCLIESGIGFSCSTAIGTLSTCTTTCGDGRYAPGSESCDDGNLISNDGCSSTCSLELGWSCTSSPNTTSICPQINECLDGSHNCLPQAQCTDTSPLWSCACLPGYTGDGVTSCVDNNECTANTHNCDIAHGSACSNTPGGFSCSPCPVGWQGNGGVGVACSDCNECNSQCIAYPCHANATCANTVGSYTCTCQGDFVGNGLTCAQCKFPTKASAGACVASSPVISDILPVAHGPLAGGSTITLVGSFFMDQSTALGSSNITSLLIGSLPCATGSVSWLTSSSISCTTPAAANGTSAVTVTLTLAHPGYAPTLSGTFTFTYHAASVVADIIPSSGPKGGGTLVAISGLGLGVSRADLLSVDLGGIPCAVQSWISASNITCLTQPAPQALAAALVRIITFSAGTHLSSNVSFAFQTTELVSLTPSTLSVFAVNPSKVLLSISLNALFPFGPNDTVLSVSFHEPVQNVSLPCALVSAPRDNPVQCELSSGPPVPATYTVRVHTSANGLAAQPQPPLAPVVLSWSIPAPTITSIQPSSSGPVSGGQLVTLGGTGFGRTAAELSAITLASQPCANTSWVTSTQIVCLTGPAAQPRSGVITVVTFGGNATGSGLQYTYVTKTSDGSPEIYSLRPSSGSFRGGFPVDLVGTALGTAPSDVADLTINGISCRKSLVWRSTSLISCTVPPVPYAMLATAPSVQVRVRTVSSGNRESTAARFTYVYPDPVFEGVFPRQASLAGAVAVTIVGQNFGETASGSISFSVRVGSGSAACSALTWLSSSTVRCTMPPQAAAVDMMPAFASERVSPIQLGFTYVTDIADICTPSCGYQGDCKSRSCVCRKGFADPPNCATPMVITSMQTPATTSEDGDTTTFSMVLATAPRAAVTVSFYAGIADELRFDRSSVTFDVANWKIAATVTVSGVPDTLRDGNVTVPIIFDPVASSDPGYTGIAVPDLSVVNADSGPIIASVRPLSIPLLGIPISIVAANLDSSFKLVISSLDGSETAVVNETAVNITYGASTAAQRALATSSSEVTLALVAPPLAITGYKHITIVNGFGTQATFENVTFYTDDCPSEGWYGRGLDCKQCPEGGICPGGYRIWPKDGYWNSGEDSGFVIKCAVPERCKGGYGANCDFPYTGITCSECLPSYSLSGGVCNKCPSAAPFVGIFVANFVIWGMLTIAAWMYQDREHLNMLLQVVLTFQNLAGIGRTIDARMPGIVARIYDILYLFSGDLGFLKPDCLGQVHFETNFLASLAYNVLIGMPMFLGVYIVRFFSVRYHRKRGSSERAQERHDHYSNRGVRILTAWVYVMYYSVTTTALSAFACIRAGDRYLISGYSNYRCFTGRHIGFMVFAGVLLLGLTIGFPLFYFFWVMRKHAAQHHEKNFAERWDMFYGQFKPGLSNFWLLDLLVSFSIAAARTLLSRQALPQFALLVSILGIALIVSVGLRPFVRTTENLAQFSVLLANVVMVTTIFCSREGKISDKVHNQLAWLLIVLVGINFFLVLSVWLYNTINHIIVSRREKARRITEAAELAAMQLAQDEERQKRELEEKLAAELEAEREQLALEEKQRIADEEALARNSQGFFGSVAGLFLSFFSSSSSAANANSPEPNSPRSEHPHSEQPHIEQPHSEQPHIEQTENTAPMPDLVPR